MDLTSVLTAMLRRFPCKERIVDRARPARNRSCRRNARRSFERRAEAVDRRNPEHVGVVEVEHALVGVLVEQRIEHRAGLLSVLREHIAFLDVVGPLAASQWFGVERHVADEIEGIEVLAQLLDQHGQRQTLSRHFLDYRLLALGGVPASQKVVKARETLAQGFPGEVA